MMISIDATTMERMTAVAMEPSGAAATPSTVGLAAQSTERLDRGRAPSSFVGVNLWVAIGAALLMHVAILAPLWLQFENSPIASPETQEIPVEIVVEQPQPTPQPQPQSSEDASTPKPPIDLEPAHDAPKAATDDKATPREGSSAKKNAEKAPPDQAQSGAKEASKDEAAPTEPTRDQPSEAKSETEPLPPGDDALALVPPPATSPAPASQAKVATMIGEPLPNWSKGKQFSTFEPVPDVDFGDMSASPVGGGAAQTTYLTVIYGLIMKHLRMTDDLRAEAEQVVGAISFVVDGHGEVTRRSVTQPSGLNALDAAALEAVREAGPYPIPPMGMPVALKFTYGGKSGG